MTTRVHTATATGLTTTAARGRRGIAAAVVGALTAVLLVLLPAVPAAAATAAAPTWDSRLLVLINQARATAGLPVVALWAPLSAQASTWSARNASRDVLQHDPSYGSKAATVCGLSVARENVAYTTGSADSMFRAYMNSPGHRANILSRDTQFVGLGTVSAPWAAHPSIAMHWNTMRFVGGSCPKSSMVTSSTPTTLTLAPMATPATKGKAFVIRVALAAPAGPRRTATLTFTSARTGATRTVAKVTLVPGSTHPTYYRGAVTVSQSETGTWRISYAGKAISSGVGDRASSRAVRVSAV